MKYYTLIVGWIVVLLANFGSFELGIADDNKNVEQKPEKVITEIKEGAKETGKDIIKTGKTVTQKSKEVVSEIKENSVKTGVAVKNRVVGIGQEIKEGFKETKDSIIKEIRAQSSDK